MPFLNSLGEWVSGAYSGNVVSVGSASGLGDGGVHRCWTGVLDG